MDLKEIMSVSGHSGLFKYVSQGRNGIIVESFADNKRIFVSASQKVSSLGDIAIFTDGDEVPLKEVFRKIHEIEPGVPAPDPKSSPETLKAFMEKILPNYDRNRVYVSDLKKLVGWYNSLLAANMLSFEDETAEKEAPEPAEKPAEEKKKEKKEEKKEEAVKTPSKTKKSAPKKPAGKKK